MVVFDSADLDSAVEGAVDAAWFNQGQVVYIIQCLITNYQILVHVSDK
jgi:acyl-CoA reductase-like NAD-dependent aldehyde dehydrogenase